MTPTDSAASAIQPPAKPQHFALARWTPRLALVLTAVGLVLRAWEIGTKGLWLDEAFSVWLAWQPWREMLAWLVRIDQHPPLYYTLLHLWITLTGDTPGAVRQLSALLGTATIPVIFCLGRRLMGGRVGLLAALILALSPFHVRFAQETRMYTLLALNAALALLALAHLLTDGRAAATPIGRQSVDFCRSWRATRQRPPFAALATDLAWAGTIFFTAATLWSHNTAVFFLLAVNGFVLGLAWVKRWPAPAPFDCVPAKTAGTPLRVPALSARFGFADARHGDLQPPALRNWLIAQIGVFLLWSPWLVAFVQQSVGVYREFWIAQPTLRTVLATVKTFLSAMFPAHGGWANLIWIAYGLIGLLGGVRLRRSPARLAFLAVIFLTPLAGEWLVSLRRPIFYDQTLIWATFPLYLLLAAGIAGLRRKPYIVSALALIIVVNGLSLQEYYLRFTKEEWDQAAAYVAARGQPDDLLIFNATWVQIPFDYYFRAYARPVTQHGAPVDLFDRGVLEPKMAESDLPRLHELIADKPRVWLIYSHNWYTDPHGLIPAALAQDLKQLDLRRFNGLEVRLYGRP